MVIEANLTATLTFEKNRVVLGSVPFAKAAVGGVSMADLLMMHAEKVDGEGKADASDESPVRGRRPSRKNMSDSEDGGRHKSRKGGKGGKAKSKKGRRGPSRCSSSAMKTPKKTPQSGTAGAAGTSAGGAPIVEGFEDVAGPGRKARPLHETVAQQVDMFKNGSADTLHFGEARGTALRCVRRYVAQACTKLSTTKKKDEQVSVELFKKTLMMIESGMKINQEWCVKKNIQIGVLTFKKAWKNLVAYCESEPAVELQCDFLRELNLKVLSYDAGDPSRMHEEEDSFINHLLFKRLRNEFSGDDVYLRSLQRKYLTLAFSHLLESALTASAVLDPVQQIVGQVKANQGDFEESLVNEVHTFGLLVQSASKTGAWSDVKELEVAIGAVPQILEPKHAEAQLMVCLLRR